MTARWNRLPRAARKLGVLLGTAVVLAGTAGTPAGAAPESTTEPTANSTNSAPADAEASAFVKAAATGERVEIVDRRAEDELVYANPDGTLTSETSVQPQRVRRADGSWEKADATLERRPDGTVGPKAAVVDLAFAAGGTSDFVTLGEEGKSFTLRWPTPLPEPVLDGDTAEYREVLPGVDLLASASVTGYSLTTWEYDSATLPNGKGRLASATKWVGDGAEKKSDTGGARDADAPAKGKTCETDNSFTPGTLVLMADGSTKPIEDVEIGDKVLATDPETGETTAETVTAEIRGEGVKHLVELTVDTDGDTGRSTDTITATDGHPFWVPELGEWVDATDLQSGQWLRTSAGTLVQVTAVNRWTATDQTVHNLTVADLHTYFVLAGAAPVLVHNCGGEIDYGSIDADGRRSGIVAIVTPSMLGTGTKATRRMGDDLPGFVSGANGDARGHLLPRALGGSGTTKENIVRTTESVDNGVMNEFEKKIAAYVGSGNGNTIMYSATPHYRPGSNVAYAVTIEAFDDTGWNMTQKFMQ